MRTSAAIADFGAGVRRRLHAWWDRVAVEESGCPVSTYFGETARHAKFKRTVWHSTQHTRQIGSLLEQAGIIPDHPLGPGDLRGLPLTDRIWDEATLLGVSETTRKNTASERQRKHCGGGLGQRSGDRIHCADDVFQTL
jgi:hypothetical protein